MKGIVFSTDAMPPFRYPSLIDVRKFTDTKCRNDRAYTFRGQSSQGVAVLPAKLVEAVSVPLALNIHGLAGLRRVLARR